MASKENECVEMGSPMRNVSGKLDESQMGTPPETPLRQFGTPLQDFVNRTIDDQWQRSMQKPSLQTVSPSPIAKTAALAASGHRKTWAESPRSKQLPVTHSDEDDADEEPSTPASDLEQKGTPKQEVERQGTPEQEVDRLATPEQEVGPQNTPEQAEDQQCTPEFSPAEGKDDIEDELEVETESIPLPPNESDLLIPTVAVENLSADQQLNSPAVAIEHTPPPPPGSLPDSAIRQLSGSPNATAMISGETKGNHHALQQERSQHAQHLADVRNFYERERQELRRELADAQRQLAVEREAIARERAQNHGLPIPSTSPNSASVKPEGVAVDPSHDPEAAVTELKSQIHSLSLLLEEKRHECIQLRRHSKKHEEVISLLREQAISLRDALTEAKRTEQQIRDCEQGLRKQRNQENILARQIIDENDLLRREVIKLRAELDETHDALKVKVAELSQRENAARTRAERDLREKDFVIEALRDRVTQLQESARSAEEREKATVTAVDSLRTQLRVLDEENRTLRAENATLRSDLTVGYEPLSANYSHWPPTQDSPSSAIAAANTDGTAVKPNIQRMTTYRAAADQALPSERSRLAAVTPANPAGASAAGSAGMGSGERTAPLVPAPSYGSMSSSSQQTLRQVARETVLPAVELTEGNIKDVLAITARINGRLTALCQERDTLNALYAKMPPGHGRSRRERDEKASMERRLEDIGREVSQLRLQLRHFNAL
eukprot:Clim_evm26s169 gene=Clim_evmTU26s169